MGSERLEYLCYRCYTCGRLLTKLEILRTWERGEAAGTSHGAVCPCGGGRITPGNPTPEEEKHLLSEEQKRRYYVDHIVDADTRLVELWDKEIKGKTDLGPYYEVQK